MAESREVGTRGGRAEGAATLDKVVETVRRILRADTASLASFSESERTITWLATSGFRNVEAEAGGITLPVRGEFAERAAAFDQASGETIFEVRGLAGDLPESEFPLHSAEGVRDLVIARLRARGQSLGLLAVGYRGHHRFTADERQQLEGLAEMAALALDNARLLDTLGAAKRVWEQTFDAIPDGIIVHDDRMTVVRCNMAAAEAMGLHPSDVAGMSCGEAFARLFGERAAAYHMRPGTPRTTSSFELQAEDGRRYLVSVAPLSSLESGVWSLESEEERRAGPDSPAGDAQSEAGEETGPNRVLGLAPLAEPAGDEQGPEHEGACLDVGADDLGPGDVQAVEREQQRGNQPCRVTV